MYTDKNTISKKFSAIIVAGGLNSRMGGINKAFLKVGGKTIISRLMQTLENYFDEILLVTKNPEEYSGYLIRTVTDIYEARSALTGIHSGLYHAKNYFSFVVPCDAPFIQPSLIELLFNSTEPQDDVIIPYYNGYYQPLCAIYSKHCIPEIEILLNSGDYRIYNFFHSIKLKTIGIEKLKAVDSEMVSFININSCNSYRKI